jgi:16S rRNA (cytosine967-C5)-methyltransferase
MKAAAQAKQILDLCAGPGGKAALLSAIAHRDGQRFVANEVSEARAELVKRVVRNSAVWCTDGRMIASQEMKFDAVLADVPCTGLGALRRRPEVRWRRTVQDLRGLIELQMELVSGAISVLEPQGIFGYATCSPHYAETSAQVKTILKRYPELEQLDVAQFIPENLQGATRDGALSLWTSAHQTDSMFLALFRKRENTVEP